MLRAATGGKTATRGTTAQYRAVATIRERERAVRSCYERRRRCRGKRQPEWRVEREKEREGNGIERERERDAET